jgi:hypothetical protein
MTPTGRSRLRRQLDTVLRLAAGKLGRRKRVTVTGLAVPHADSPDVDAGDHASDAGALESRLVWILGSPRTGSTWLLRLLVHPWVLARSDPTGMRAPLGHRSAPRPDVVPVDESYLLHHLTPLRSVPDGERQPPTAGFVINGARRGDPGYFFSDEYAPTWVPELHRLVLARLRAQTQRATERHGLSDPLVLIKEPNGSQGAELLMSLLPRSRMIFLLRDGRDVIDSMLDARGAEGWVEGSMDLTDSRQRLAYVRRQARLWLNCTNAVQAAYAAHPDALRWTVRYEDLRRDTADALGPLLDWLGIHRCDAELRETVEANSFESIPPALKGPGTPRRSATPGTWRANLTAAEQDAMHAIIGQKLHELGYEPA